MTAENIDFVGIALQEMQRKPPENTGFDFVSVALEEIKQEGISDLSPIDQALATGSGEVLPGSAGAFANLKAGIAGDVNTDIEIFAKSIFPNMPIEQSKERFSILDGEIVYLDKDGKLKTPNSGRVLPRYHGRLS